ncbi:UDP-galactose/UDP-glucose transporter 5B [Bienertia sinuspersici]
MESPLVAVKENKLLKGVFAVGGIMLTLVIYGVLQEKIMRIPYGQDQEYFKHSLFLVFCNRLTTSAVSAASLAASKKALDPVAPVYKYCLVSVTNILTTTCQYEVGNRSSVKALKYVSFPVQTLAKCAKMIPVMVSMGYYNYAEKIQRARLFVAVLVTIGCSVFILYPAGDDVSPTRKGEKAQFGVCPSWLVILGTDLELQLTYCISSYAALSFAFEMFDVGRALFLVLRPLTLFSVEIASCLSQASTVLKFDGFTSTFQDNLFKGYNMEIHNQIFYTTLCSCVLSLTGLVLQGQLFSAVDFIHRHHDCLYDIALLSTVATASQFFISYTIRTFGALTFATIMTTRQLISILLSCLWFAHPLSPLQFLGAAIVFGSLYAKSFLKSNTLKPPPPENTQQDTELAPLKGNP